MPNNITLKLMRNKEREKTPKCLQDQQLTPLYVHFRGNRTNVETKC